MEDVKEKMEGKMKEKKKKKKGRGRLKKGCKEWKLVLARLLTLLLLLLLRSTM